MKILIIESGKSKLSSAIVAEANKLKPKPEGISTMMVDIERFNLLAFKRDLYYLAPDVIILNYLRGSPDSLKWTALVQEALRHIDMTSGRIVFISSVEVLGDSIMRTEGAIVSPFTDYAVSLHTTEMLIESSTPRHYIMRFPDRIDDTFVQAWAKDKQALVNERFNLITLEDMAKHIVEKIQSGWFGKYHVTPNDSLLLSDLMDLRYIMEDKRIEDSTLASKSNWSISKSIDIWNNLVKELQNENTL